MSEKHSKESPEIEIRIFHLSSAMCDVSLPVLDKRAKRVVGVFIKNKIRTDDEYWSIHH